MHDRGHAADDAGASEVAFMLDENSYPTDSILGTITLPRDLRSASCTIRLLQRLQAPRLPWLQLRAGGLLFQWVNGVTLGHCTQLPQRP